MNKLKQAIRVAWLSVVMSILPAKFTPAIAQNFKQNHKENLINDEFGKYMQNKDNENFFKQPIFRSMWRVIDGEWDLTDEEEAKLELLIVKIENETKLKIELITTNKVDIWFLEEFCADYGNGTGLWDSKFHDNGVVFVMNKSEHKSGISIGDHTQFVLWNGDARNIRKAGREKFYAGDYLGYLEAVANKISTELTVQDKKDIESDTKQADKDLTEEEEKSRDDMFWSIFYSILFGGSAIGWGIVLKKKKEEYDKLVDQYNRKINNLSKISWIKELDDQSAEIIKKLKQDEKYINIVQEIGFLCQAATSSLSSIYSMGDSDKYILSFGDFMNGGTKKVKAKLLIADASKNQFDSWRKDVENNLWEIIKIDSKINKTVNIILEISTIKGKDKLVIDLADKYEKEWFIIGKLDKSINDKSAAIDNIFEQLKNEEYYKNTQMLDKWILAFEDISNLSLSQTTNHTELVLQIDYYTNKDKYISDNKFDNNSFANASDIYSDLMAICPRDFVSAKISLDDIKNNINTLHAKLVERINNIYESKDLEKLANAMNMYIDNAKDTKEKISDSSKMLSEQINAKFDCETKIKNISRVDDIYYYDDELSRLNNKYSSLSNKIRGDKNDWIGLLVEIKQLVIDYTNLKSKAVSKKRSDDQKIIDDANESARNKAVEDRRSEDNDRFGGWSFSPSSGNEWNI